MPTTLPKVEKPLAAIDIARCFIKIAHDQVVQVPETGQELHEDITHLKLQKLLYFAQAAHLAAHGAPLFSDEIQAWKFGPVVPTVYQIFRDFESRHIPSEEGHDCDEQVEVFLKEVWKTFAKYSASELVHLSHKVGPWENFYKPNHNNVIPVSAIQESFENVFDFSKHEQPATPASAA